MMNFKSMLVAAALATSISAAPAMVAAAPVAATIGMSLEAASALYPQARRLTSERTDATKLELVDVDFASTRWRTVDLVFDAEHRLQSVQLITTAESYDQLKAQVASSYDAFLGVDGDSRLVSNPLESIQLRICDRGTAGVYLTYERPSSAV